jgi:hypothetical protein
MGRNLLWQPVCEQPYTNFDRSKARWNDGRNIRRPTTFILNTAFLNKHSGFDRSIQEQPLALEPVKTESINWIHCCIILNTAL